MTPAQENAWQLLTQTERKLADQRAALKQERDAFEARQASMQAAQDELQTLKNRLQADFPGMARDFGWDDQRLAQNIISRYQPGHVDPTPPPAPQITQPASAQPAQPAQPAYDKSWATQVENAIVSTNYTVAALAPEFDLIRSEPNGIQSAIQKALQYQAIGTSLTPQQALAMAQDELVEQHRALLAARDADPRWQRALGSPGSPAPQAPGQPAPQVTQPHTPGDEPITALNNDVSAAPTMPPVELGQPLTEAQRLERARQAVARLRAGQ